MVRRVPKRGFRPVRSHRVRTVNLRDLGRFEDGAEVTPETLRAVGLVRGHDVEVKVLGGGTLSRKLLVRAHAFSRAAREKIEAAGGRCEVIG